MDLPRFSRGASTLLLFAASAAGVAGAAEAAIDVSGNVAVVSDYRFRGVSLSGRDLAVQGGVDLALGGGWSVGTWASSIARYGGSHVELDLYGAGSGDVAGFGYSLTAYGYVYPGGSGVDYAEVQGDLGREFGPLSLSVQAAYSPNQHNTTSDNVYAGIKAAVALPATHMTLSARAGLENGFYDHKVDWEVGVRYERGPLALSASVLGTNRSGAGEIGRLAGRGITLSALASF